MALLPKGSKALTATAAAALLAAVWVVGCGAEEGAAFARTCPQVHRQVETIAADGAAGEGWSPPPLAIAMGYSETLDCLHKVRDGFFVAAVGVLCFHVPEGQDAVYKLEYQPLNRLDSQLKCL